MRPLFDPIRREAMPPSWRALSNDPFWDRWPVVIASNQAARPSYESWVDGRPFANRPRLQETKNAVEAKYGPQQWTMVKLPLIEVEHYYFGPTEEFTDPTTLWVVETLSTTGSRNRIYNALQEAMLWSGSLAGATVTSGGTWVLLDVRRGDASLQAHWGLDGDDVVFEGVKIIVGGTANSFDSIPEAAAVFGQM